MTRAAYILPARPLAIGDLVGFEDHAGRTIGCRVTRMWSPGEISTTEHVEVVVCGMFAPAPYIVGMIVTIEASKVHPAD